MNTIDEERKKELSEKIEKAKQQYEKAFSLFRPEETRLIWSGGKDSTLMVWTCLQYCREQGAEMPPVFTIDEFDTFDEIDEFLKRYSAEWGLSLDWGRNDDVLEAAGHTLGSDVKVADLNERNRAEIERIGFDVELFPFEAESYVGNHLMKTVVFNRYIEEHGVKAVFQGIRWDEQEARKYDEYFEEVAGDEFTPAHTRVRPILHFTERDIWDTTHGFGIPYCTLYEHGYRSLGAKTTSVKSVETPAWEQDLENTEERAGRRQDKEQAMERLRKLGYM